MGEESKSQASQNDHWRDLAAELGLPPDEGPGPAAAPLASASRPAVTGRPEPQTSAPEALSAAEMDIDEGLGFQRPEESERQAAIPSDEDEGQPSGPFRRRGRRGPRREQERSAASDTVQPDFGDEEAAVAEQEVVAEVTESLPQEDASAGTGEEFQQPPRRRRGRQQSRAEVDEPSPGPEDEDLDEVAEGEAETEAIQDDDQDDDDEPDTLADWNVPSWQELIASLYRPER